MNSQDYCCHMCESKTQSCDTFRKFDETFCSIKCIKLYEESLPKIEKKESPVYNRIDMGGASAY